LCQFYSIFLSTRQKRQTNRRAGAPSSSEINLLKRIYNTQSKWQVGIDDRLFSSAHYCFPGGFVSSVFFVGRYWWNTHTTHSNEWMIFILLLFLSADRLSLLLLLLLLL
jgi:hypothetical protein